MVVEDLKIRQYGKCTSAKYYHRNKYYADDQVFRLPPNSGSWEQECGLPVGRQAGLSE
jgi:hypothetical protein